MQSVVFDKKEPSARLRDKIKSCVTMFRSLGDTVAELIDIGKDEGFSPREIGILVKEEMIKSGLSRATVAHYLPSEFKGLPRGKPGTKPVSKNTLQKGYSSSASNSISSKFIEFEATITANQDKRKIAIPAKFRDEIDRGFHGKVKVRVERL